MSIVGKFKNTEKLEKENKIPAEPCQPDSQRLTFFTFIFPFTYTHVHGFWCLHLGVLTAEHPFELLSYVPSRACAVAWGLSLWVCKPPTRECERLQGAGAGRVHGEGCPR